MYVRKRNELMEKSRKFKENIRASSQKTGEKFEKNLSDN